MEGKTRCFEGLPPQSYDAVGQLSLSVFFSLCALALALSFAYGGVSVLTAKCCEPVPTKHDRLPPRSLLGLAVLFSSGIAGLLLRLAFLAVLLPLARPRAMQTDGDRDRG